MLLGYNTNGFAHHRLEDALQILADLGCQSVALTLDYHSLNPYDADLADQVARAKQVLIRNDLHCVVETGARFLLDPLRKHQPTLVSGSAEGRQKRLDFLGRAVAIARELNADAVSFWSGKPDDAADAPVCMDRLADGCARLCELAAAAGVRLAFEPEPGMVVDTMDRFAELHRRVDHPAFGLTLDIGHLHCLGEVPMERHLRRWKAVLWNVHIEDMRRGVHDHLMFGEGEIDFPPVLATFKEIDYGGGVHVELSRHSHDAVETARRSMAFLRARL